MLLKKNEVQAEFELLFQDIKKNQTHPSDLLLVILNGNYYPEIKSFLSPEEKKSPYMIGPTSGIHSYNLHHEFIADYIFQSISEYKYDQ